MQSCNSPEHPSFRTRRSTEMPDCAIHRLESSKNPGNQLCSHGSMPLFSQSPATSPCHVRHILHHGCERFLNQPHEPPCIDERDAADLALLLPADQG